MLLNNIKYFFIIICSLYIFCKVQNIKISKNNWFKIVTFSLIFPFFIYFIRLYYPPLSLIIIPTIFIIFVVFLFKNTINTNVTVSLISLGLSYASSIFAALVWSLLMFFLIEFIFIDLSKYYYIFESISYVIVGFFQMSILYKIFRIKRFRKGIPQLNDFLNSDVGVFISVSILLSASFLSFTENEDIIFIIPIFFIFICGMLFLFWWRNRLTKTYLEGLKNQELNELNQLLSEKEGRIADLKRENDRLASIIHRDNKVLPAMKHILNDILSEEGASRISKESQDFLDYLNKELKIREANLLTQQIQNTSVPKIGISSIDTMIQYMHTRAAKEQILFDLSVCANIKFLVENIIEETDFVTLLADLIENSMIAVKHSDPKKILVSLGLAHNHYEICVFDSGIPFKSDTLKNFGLKKNTTHAHEGGSGIGLVTILELAKKWKATIFIEEYRKGIYSKCVRIIFDGKSEYKLKSDRVSEFVGTKREDFILIRPETVGEKYDN